MDSELDFTGASIEERIVDDGDGHGKGYLLQRYAHFSSRHQLNEPLTDCLFNFKTFIYYSCYFSTLAVSVVGPPTGPNARRYQPAPAPSIQLPNQDAEYVNHIAIDIGGSLIKLVYFSPDPVDNGSSSEGDTPSGSPPSSSPGISGSGDHLTQAAAAATVPQRRSPQQQSSSRGGTSGLAEHLSKRKSWVSAIIPSKPDMPRVGDVYVYVWVCLGGLCIYVRIFATRITFGS